MAIVGLGFAMALAAGQNESASSQPAALVVPPKTPVVRVYDVKDILVYRRDMKLPYGIVPPTGPDEPEKPVYGGNSIFGRKETELPGDSHLDLDALVRVISSSIAPGSWKGAKAQGFIRYVGAQLVVRQTPAIHREIQELLEAFRKVNAGLRRVSVQAKWVLLDNGQLAKLMPPGNQRREVPRTLGPEKLKDLKVPYRAEITCFEGQTVHIASGRGQTVMTDAEPVISESAVAYAPTVSTVLWGALLEISTVLSDDGTSATVDVRSVVSEPKKMGSIPFAKFHGGSTTAPAVTVKGLDRLEFAIHALRTTTRIPVGKHALIGGMTAPEGALGKNLYLILQISAGK